MVNLVTSHTLRGGTYDIVEIDAPHIDVVAPLKFDTLNTLSSNQL
jgi:hypothetical protein